jgi:hypothetical protein
MGNQGMCVELPNDTGHFLFSLTTLLDVERRTPVISRDTAP